MKRLLLPALLALAGLGGGVGAGLALRPPSGAEAPAEDQGQAGGPEEGGGATDGGGDVPPRPSHGTPAGDAPAAAREFVKLNNQFVVPVVGEGRVTALVVLSVSLEVGAGGREGVFAHEPKLRDAFLQVLFAHANAGGFDGNFTAASALRTLRAGLLEAAQGVLGDLVSDVLIIDMMRQDS